MFSSTLSAEIYPHVDLSIIIVNWNSADYLRSCLTSVHSETRGISFEVIVVDNASYDGSEKMVRDLFPGVKFVQSDSNLGFARANNLGFLQAKGNILLFLNPDTEVVDGALATMTASLRADASAGAAGARLLNTDGSLQTSCVQSIPTIANQVLDFDLLRRLFPKHGLWGTRALYLNTSEPVRVDAISGACFMVRRDVFEGAARFSEQYFMYADDLDLSYKIKKAGYGILYLNECKVIHHGGKCSSQQEDNFSDLWQRESMAQFFHNAHGRVYSGMYRSAMAVVAVVRLGIVFCAAVLGGIGLQGKSPISIMRKWSKIFRWAVGLDTWPQAATKRIGS